MINSNKAAADFFDELASTFFAIAFHKIGIQPTREQLQAAFDHIRRRDERLSRWRKRRAKDEANE